MPVRAGQIVIDVQAGTSKFVMDLEQAKGKIREFGNEAQGSTRTTVAAFKTLEGGFPIRAAAAFANNVLNIGNALAIAFPVVGALAFGNVLIKIGGEVRDFFKAIEQMPGKIAAEFLKIIEPLHQASDELDAANARLENDIAKLEGKRQNNLAVALADAAVAADKLGESIQKDIQAVNELLEKQKESFLQKMFTGDSDVLSGALRNIFGGETGLGGLQAEIRKIRAKEQQDLEALKNAKPVESPIHIVGLDRAAMAQRAAESIRHSADQAILNRLRPMQSGLANVAAQGDWSTADRERLDFIRQYVVEEIAKITKSEKNTDLTAKKSNLEIARANEALDKPFRDRMAAIAAETEQTRVKLLAVGQPEWAQNLLKASGDAQKAIEEINKALEKNHLKLTDAQMGAITNALLNKQNIAVEAEWQTHLDQTTRSLNDRIAAQQALTAAIGKGYEAAKSASVGTSLAGALGAHYGDARWMQSHTADVAGLRAKFGAQYDAQYGQQVASTIDRLTQQTEAEKRLAAAQAQGADAVRKAELGNRILEIRRNNSAEAAEKLVKAETDLYNAQRQNRSAANIASLDEETAAYKKMAAAIWQGVEAARQQNLENRYAQMRRSGATNDEISAARRKDEAEHRADINKEAEQRAFGYQDELKHLAEIKAALEAQKERLGESREIDAALRDLEAERLHIAAQQALQYGTARDQLRAFFLEMQSQAKKASTIIYDSLNSAIDKLSDQFANLFTGKKTNFGQMFQELGHEMEKSAIKSGLQKGLGALGAKIFGKDNPITDALKGKPDGSKDNPYYVKVVGNAPGNGLMEGEPSIGSGLGSLGGILGALGGIAGVVGGLFGGGAGAGLNEAVSSSISYMAEGGSVDPYRTYVVGEHEPEFFTPRSAGSITPMSKLPMGGGTNHYYTIDARGAALGVENRISRSIDAAHASAIQNSVRAVQQRQYRTPQRKS